MGSGAVLLGVLAVPDLGEVDWGALPTSVWLNVAYLAVGAAAVANLLYYRGVADVGPAAASLMMFLVACMLGVLVRGGWELTRALRERAPRRGPRRGPRPLPVD
ncbi:hypothetical protein AB0L06_30220 [Spirillospora sp. NPDC052269]